MWIGTPAARNVPAPALTGTTARRRCRTSDGGSSRLVATPSRNAVPRSCPAVAVARVVIESPDWRHARPSARSPKTREIRGAADPDRREDDRRTRQERRDAEARGCRPCRVRHRDAAGRRESGGAAAAQHVPHDDRGARAGRDDQNRREHDVGAERGIHGHADCSCCFVFEPGPATIAPSTRAAAT